MKTALTIEYFDPAKGGGETYVRNFGRALLAAGHEVHEITNEWNVAENDLVFHRVPTRPMKLLRRWTFARRTAKMLQGESFDIIHGFGKSVYMDVFRPGGGVHRAWLEQELKAVGTGPKRFLSRMRQKLSLDHRLVLRLEAEQFRRAGPFVIANSRMVREQILRFYPASPERIRVIYNGVDLDRFHPRNRERFREETRKLLGLDHEVTLLFVGHNFKRKGLRPAIRAVACLKDSQPPIRLLVLGGGKQARYAAETAELGAEHMVQYVGPSREPERFYAAADMLVFPSYYDPCANVVLEALASGLPVVTSIFNGAGELITQGKEGYVVDPDDTGALVGAIRELLRPDTRRAAGVAARALAETRPLERNFKEIMELYDIVLAEKRRSRKPSPRPYPPT